MPEAAARFYFDHNACTPVDPRVLEAFVQAEAELPANAGSLHQSGRRVRHRIEEARARCATALGVHEAAVTFVSGGTEANNLAIHGKGDARLPVLLAALEHPSVLAAAAARGSRWWQINSRAEVQLQRPSKPVGMLALVHGQNEVGSLQPVFEAGQLANQLGVPLHVDASQTLGRCPLDEVFASAHSVCLSTHKAGGLRGCALLIDQDQDCRPLLLGGGQESGRRPGTESPALILATAVCVELAVAEQAKRADAMNQARTAFLSGMRCCAFENLTPPNSLPNTLMLMFTKVSGRELLPAFDMCGVEASQGSACSAGSPTPPRVLQAMGLSEAAARRCVRFSFSADTSAATAARGGALVDDCVAAMQQRIG